MKLKRVIAALATIAFAVLSFTAASAQSIPIGVSGTLSAASGAGSVVTLVSLYDQSTCTASLVNTSSYSGAVTAYVTNDPTYTNWTQTTFSSTDGTVASATTVTQTNMPLTIVANCAGMRGFRVQTNSYASGSASVVIYATTGSSNVLAGAPIQSGFLANTPGGGCSGINLSTGAPIVESNITLSPAASTTTTQIVALVAGQMTHICEIDIEGDYTTGITAGVVLQYGTGANCVTGKTTLRNFLVPTGIMMLPIGNGDSNLIDVPSGEALCYSTGAFVALFATTVNIVVATY